MTDGTADGREQALLLVDDGWKLLRADAAVRQDWDRCSAAAAAQGLRLTKENIRELHVRRGEALAATGRVEFGRGVVRELVEAFASSVYVTSDDFEETVADVQDLFYQLKEEAEHSGGVADEDLVAALRWAFDEVACGSTALLEGVGLDSLRAWVEHRQVGAFDQTPQFDYDEGRGVAVAKESECAIGGECDELDRIFEEQRMQQARTKDAVGFFDGEEGNAYLERGSDDATTRMGGSRLA